MKKDRKYPELKKNDDEDPEVDPDVFKKKLIFNTLNNNYMNNNTKEQKEPEENNIDDESYKYEWLKIIGQGTFGVVYKAKDIENNTIVAIKKVYQDPKYSNREFKIVVKLNHPNCIKVHHYFFSQKEGRHDEIYLNLVMDYIPDTLYKILRFYYKKNYDFPNALGKIYSYQMLRSLAYIHNLNICHRDIKPQNILINIKNHKLVMCDFGSAKILNKGDKSVAYICSRYYRAPELILGRDQYGVEIDIWSIGCVIAEMFIGEPLFCGKDSKDQFKKIMQLLGSPTKDDIKNMHDSIEVDLPNIKGYGLKKRLKNCDPLLIDFLSKLLVYNPKKRPKPFEMLAHPYFDDLRLQKLTINGRAVSDLFDFTKGEIGNNVSLARKLTPSWYK